MSTFSQDLSYPSAVGLDSSDNVYVFEAGAYKVTKITPEGVKSLLAGGTKGFTDGQGSVAQFSEAEGIAVDISGNVYVADTFNCSIRKVSPSGVVTTIAGRGKYGFLDGIGSEAQFRLNRGIAIDETGTLYVADSGNNAIRKVSPTGIVTTIAGNGLQGFADGLGSLAMFNGCDAITLDGDGSMLVADYSNSAVRRVSAAGQVSTLPAPLGRPFGIARVSNMLYVSDGATVCKIER